MKKYVNIFPIMGTNNSAYNVVELKFIDGNFEPTGEFLGAVSGTYKEVLDYLHENNLIKVN